MKGSVRIQKEQCKGCGYCIEACPRGVLKISTQFNSIGYFPAYAGNKDLCTGCAVCATVCPEIAITVYREKKKKVEDRTPGGKAPARRNSSGRD